MIYKLYTILLRIKFCAIIAIITNENPDKVEIFLLHTGLTTIDKTAESETTHWVLVLVAFFASF